MGNLEMFTGLIQQVGKLNRTETVDGGQRLFIGTAEWRPRLAPGESIAVSGVCLTVSHLQGDEFACDVLQETLGKTTLGRKHAGCSLNLERALAVGSPMGGHMVTGHVDGTGNIILRKTLGRDWVLRIACDDSLMNGMVLKGSVACDGVSLTIADLNVSGHSSAGATPEGATTDVKSGADKASSPSGGFFEVHLVPYTWSHTALNKLKEGDYVNIETDIIGKYVYRYMNIEKRNSDITIDRLREAGFDNA